MVDLFLNRNTQVLRFLLICCQFYNLNMKTWPYATIKVLKGTVKGMEYYIIKTAIVNYNAQKCMCYFLIEKSLQFL